MKKIASAIFAASLLSFTCHADTLSSGNYSITSIVDSADRFKSITDAKIALRVEGHRVRYLLTVPCETHRGSFEKKGDRLSMIVQLKTSKSCDAPSNTGSDSLASILAALEAALSYRVRTSSGGDVVVIFEGHGRKKLSLRLDT